MPAFPFFGVFIALLLIALLAALSLWLGNDHPRTDEIPLEDMDMATLRKRVEEIESRES